MKIIPAIDLRQGKCVRLQQGCFDRLSVYEASPVQLARQYAGQGATHLHVVDLDGAKSGQMCQLTQISKMQVLGLTVQAGGGIRSMASSKACLDTGIDRQVIGSIAISDPDLTLQIISRIGAENIVLAIDVNRDTNGVPTPAIHGWQTATSRNLWDTVAFYRKAGIRNILCTDIACDGMMQGPSFELYKQAVGRFPDIAWQASGGIRGQADIRQLSETGVTAVILGRVLYESSFDLSACICSLQETMAC